MTRIAVVGMACRYPDASSPRELWENALTGRRAFRRLPDERMNLADYWDADPAAPDRFYARTAAVIEGYEFDRLGYRIAGSTYRSTDLTHWLALDTAARALADAGFPLGAGLPRERTSVIVGNSLTGEFTRANLMRLRWPYVRRTVGAQLRAHGWDDVSVEGFLDGLEQTYKAPFPPIDEDTLAGGLSNTIAGRICNHFDLKGGGYTVDGACSSSLLSVATAARGLTDGEVDVAVAGGVDLSIDPFEIIGFAKTGALATGEMRVYDRRSNGFWPGEGCGMVVLMREADARAANLRVYATVAGWGISSDGKGGITRPEVSGYRLMLQKAYERAGFGVETVGLFEGHGTGTEVGDRTELTALAQARAAATAQPGPAAIGSIKGMIGHTKAAAGVAGLIKAVMAVHDQVLPPTIGCVEPHEVLAEGAGGLRPLRAAEPWPEGVALRAGVTAMGFGGINSHIVVEGAEPARTGPLRGRLRDLAGTIQDAELLLVDAPSAQELRTRLAELAEWVAKVSYGELADVAAAAQRRLRDLPYRAAVVVSAPEEAARRLGRLVEALDAGETRWSAPDRRAFLGHAPRQGRVGFLFPGQGSGRGPGGGVLRRRYPEVAEVFATAAVPEDGDQVATEVAQPRIVTGSLAALRVLGRFGVQARVAVGHSLGELTALHWAGAVGEPEVIGLAAERGRIMAEASGSGTMAGVAADPERTAPLLEGLPVVIAGYNGPAQTVVAGPGEAIADVVRRAEAAGVTATPLRVSHAFHSPLVAPAADAFGQVLDTVSWADPVRRVVSTVTGAALAADVDLPALLRRQIVDPVRFTEAVTAAAAEVDLLVEVGPGSVLTNLAEGVVDVPVVALDTDSTSHAPLLGVLGAVFTAGAGLAHHELVRGRVTKPLEIGGRFSFFASPAEARPEVGPVSLAVPAPVAGSAAPVPAVANVPAPAVASVPAPAGHGAVRTLEAAPVVAASNGSSAGTSNGSSAGTSNGSSAGNGDGDAGSTLELLRALVAQRVEMPPEMVADDSHLLDDLHLSSITVGQVVNEAARALGVAVAQAPTNFATATLAELGDLLAQLRDSGAQAAPVEVVAGAGHLVQVDGEGARPGARPAAGAWEDPGEWRLSAPRPSAVAEPLRAALAAAGVGSGALVVLPEECTVDDVAVALEAAQAVLAGAARRLVLLQHGDRGAAGLAKTLRQEAPHLRVTIVHAPADPDLIPAVVAEVQATTSFAEVHLGPDGTRRVPTLRVLPSRPERVRQPLAPGDVLLVSGGGKGITAECAAALAQDSGAALALLGRSDPAADPELAANLRRFAELGVPVRYARADVADAAQVTTAVAGLTAELGPVTAVLHGAGRNEPTALTALDMDAVRRTFDPKVHGLDAVLAAVEPDRLKLLVTFGSIIGRAGLPGEAHYATANEWLAAATERFGREHAGCTAICMEWSVWSGVGMGERLSVVESLTRDGITPVTPEDGVALLRRLVQDADSPSVVVIAGRTGAIDTVRHAPARFPMHRFVERPLVHVPGVELVTEVELNAGTDLYLADHLLDGNLLLPAVFGMEAMAQVGAAVTGAGAAPVLEDAEFLRPIVVPPQGTTTVRVAALAVDERTVQVVIRSSETGYAAEHFRARLCFGGAEVPQGAPDQTGAGTPPVPLDPAADLYGGVLFQGGRFQRLRTYHRAAARHVDADVAALDVDWFAAFLAPDLLLGDPGVRDTLMHGNQVCVPDATLLPVRVDRIWSGGERLRGTLRYSAEERSRDGDTYVYDIAVRDHDGTVVERWEGLHLQAVRKGDGTGPWVPALLGSYLERGLGDLIGAELAVAVEPHDAVSGVAERRAVTATALARAVGRPVSVQYRPDGRPELPGGPAVSASHGPGLTLAVAGSGRVGCDAQVVQPRTPEDWDGLLGHHAALRRLLAAELTESADVAATRVWAAAECLQKAEVPAAAPLTLTGPIRAGWVVLSSGDLRIATFSTTVRGVADPVVFAFLTEGRS